MKFIYSWRWFGPNDRIQLSSIKQAGASAVVTALHQIPVGDVWEKEDIIKRKKVIEDAGLVWNVVESLPVSEDIKRQTGNYLQHIENYKISIENLAKCGINVICYNFMPVLDWSRTNLKVTFSDGSQTSGFKLHAFAAFDLFILQRENSQKDYPVEIIEKAKEYFNKLDVDGKKALRETIMYGLPGSLETYSMDKFKNALSLYNGIDRNKLKTHLNFFLNEIIPVAEENNIKMAIHPDDPPWNLLGLPRIVSTIDDLKEIVGMKKSKSNGITFCTGSLGVGYFNNLSEIAAELAPNIHFIHLRNVVRDKDLNFQEETFFEGDVDMIELVKILVSEGKKMETLTCEPFILPVRPDHGHQMLEDIGKDNYPGYSLYGRMKNLAEIKGLTLAVLNLHD
ncbi:MAG: mannonate dehydratase [Prolixibacteraceae bacterium]|nr:mannonate dehydratase [Prolixibacteraceae bacterium]